MVWRQILEPTSVLRSNQRGARWNPPATEALYCSLDPETAAAEIDHLISSQPVPITRQRSTYGIDVVISRVVDMRSPKWGDGFGFSYDATDVEVCQTIGGAVAWLGAGGLLAPSQRAAGDNLVIYVANLAAADRIEPHPDAYIHPPGPPEDLPWKPLDVVD